MKALVCVAGRGWEAVVRAAAGYLPPEGAEAALVHVVDERAAGGYDLALRGLLGRSRRSPRREPELEAAALAAGEELLADARGLLARLRPDLEASTAILTGPPNEELIRRSLQEAATVVFVGRGTPDKRPRGRPEGRPGTASGELVEWRQGPRGETNGLLLDDGTEVRFPPHRADEVRAVAREGSRLEVEGEWRGPDGRHLHARRLTGSGARVEIPPEPPPRGGPGKLPLGHTARFVVDHATCDVVVVAEVPTR